MSISNKNMMSIPSIHKMNTPLTADWIWFDAPYHEDVFARARRRFTLDQVPASAVLRITCSGHYLLWVNGTDVARGPERSEPWRKRYDVIDISPHLRPGENVLAVQLIHYGYRTAHSPASPPGFWCQLDGDGLALGSDEAWRLSIDPAYARDTMRRNGCYGLIDIFDGRQDEPWTDPAYDESAWSPARAIVVRNGSRDRSGPRVTPWVDMLPRRVPQAREARIRPVAVTRLAEVENQEYAGSGMMGARIIGNLATHLLQDVPAEPEFTGIENAEALVGEDQGRGPAIITQPSPLDRRAVQQRCATLILDFGREITAYGWLDVEGNAGAEIDVAYGERLIGGRVQPVLQNTAYADRYILREGRQRHQVYDWKGYRYVQLTFRNLHRPLLLHEVGATFTSYPVQPRGAFQCSDPMLGRIWQAGAYTQQLCTHDALMDCPWREQQQWLGDGRVQLLVVQNAFGDRHMPRKFLEQFAEGQLPSGMIPCVTPGTENYIVDYALWWVQGLVDVLLFDGDEEATAALYPTLVRLLEWFEAYRNADGLLEDVEGWIFIDWANIGFDGVCAPLVATEYIALGAAVEIAERLGYDREAGRWRATAERIAARFHETFWDAERALYVDNIVDGARTGMFSQHTQALAVLTGLSQVDDADLLRRAIADESVVLTEPYFTYYLLEALAHAGLATEGLDLVRARWGDMIRGGATSLWEEWQVTGTFRRGSWIARPRSHCHAWSAAPTAWLSRHILGVRVESLDGREIVIAPQPGDLTWAKGTVPTRYGLVEIEWRVDGDDLDVRVELPPCTCATSHDPPGFVDRTRWTVTEWEVPF